MVMIFDACSSLVMTQRVMVEVLCARSGVQFVDLHHRLSDGGCRLLDGTYGGGVVEDSARHLAVSTSESQHEVQRAFFLYVVVRERASVFELLACKNQALLIRWDSLLVLDLRLDVVDGIGRLHFERDGLTRERFHEDLHDG